ncbi:MAG TPA: 50S ribosomal protein L1 [bacterium]|nr:50S ribosomal protein L1 [bacterium]
MAKRVQVSKGSRNGKAQKEVRQLVEKTKTYSLVEATELVKKTNTVKFDSSVEVHLRLGIDPRKGDQQVRGAVSLPHGTGKTVRIAAFVSTENEAAVKAAGADLVGSDELIEEIRKTEKTDFQVAVAEPALMRNLAVIAKILGTRGLMPSPKNETVTPDPVKAVTELKKGKVSFKNDETANIHVAIGKVSFSNEQLADNFQALIDAIKKSKPASSKGAYIKGATICSTMGPGIRVSLS